MGSSGSESVDFAVGSIVWVRRRNGSWWPGKILDPHDLSHNHLMSPRSGTPVKLLGREDASVDWYNLEKSKRVKAFRCGDFDDCIERAESCVGMPPKKREKYARREDAILHALELEKQMLDSQVGRLDVASDTKTSKSSVSGEKGSLSSSGNEEPDDLESLSEGVCASPLCGNGFHNVKKLKEATMPEDEAPPKMRDLHEFGLQTIPSKRKLYSSSNKADEADRIDNHFQARTTSSGGYAIERGTRKVAPETLMEGTSDRGYYRCPSAVQVPQNSSTLSSFHVDQAERNVDSRYVSAPNQINDAYWAKRNMSMHLPTESNGYLGNIRKLSPILKQGSHFPLRESKFPSQVSASDDDTSEFSEDTESDSSDSDDSETDSDEMNGITGRRDEHSIEGSEAEGRFRNMSNEELDEFALASENCADDGISKWKLKGKRNIRNKRKRSLHIPSAGIRMNDQTYHETRGNTFSNRVSRLSVNYQRTDDFDGNFEGDDSFDGEYWSTGSALRNTRYSALRHMSRGTSNNNNVHIYDWDGMPLERRTSLNGYLMETEDYYNRNQLYISHDHVEGMRRNMLVEVDLKVQSSYPKQRIPIISLTSKIDGRAIIGHSLQIEEIAEGASDTFLSKRSEFYNGRLQGEVDYYPLTSGWKTARRTANYRVPRPDLSSAVDNGGDAEYVPLGRKSNARDLNTSVASVMQKFDPYTIHYVPTLNPKIKLSKKGSISSSQKTRTLFSFSVDHQKQPIGQGRHDIEAFSPSELIKSESGSTNVPCIPVKLVFSRLYMGRPSASIAPQNHEDRANSMTARLHQQS